MKENYQKRILMVFVFLRTLLKETVIDFRLFRLAGMLRILADFLDY